MKYYSSSNLTFFMCFLICVHSVRCDIILSSCDAAAQISPNLSYDFCVSILQANPISYQIAELEGLVAVSLDLTLASAATISLRIIQLLGQNDLDPLALPALRDCFTLYTDAKSTLEDAKNDFMLKNYQTANVKVSSVLYASSTCEDGFKDIAPGQASPLNMENKNFFQLTAIDLAFFNMFH